MKKANLFLSMSLVITMVLMTLLSAAPAFTQGNPTATPLPTITSVPPVAKPEGAVELSFWYGLGGLLGNVVQETVNRYNTSQTKYYVKAVFQSSYDDTINKINAGLASGDLPNVAQIFDAGTQRMIDTKSIVPVQPLFERDGLQAVMDDMEPAVRASYTVNGVLQSAPFNSSTAMMYINRAAFKEVGLDPDKKLWTYAEVEEAAAKLTKKDANGTTVRYGLAVYPESWFLEQAYAAHNALYGEPENGRGAERMNKYTYNSEVGVAFLEFQKRVIDAGTAIYFGPGGSTPAGAAFTRGEAAMTFSSIASLRTLIAGAERSGAGVEVGVTYFPRQSTDYQFRTLVGGASLWITNTGTPEQQEGAWDFIKFAMQPEVQAFWSSNTGYYPVVRAAYELPEMKDALVKFPQFNVALEQLRLSEGTAASNFHVSGVFVSMRQDVIKAEDDFWTGKVASAKEALDAAVASSDDKLTEYNATVQ